MPAGFFLTDPKRTPHLLETVGRLPAGLGVIYRHFGAADRVDVARDLARICRRRRLVLLVAADPALARAIKADGVHWPIACLRRIRPKRNNWIETASAHSRRDLVRAARMGVDAALLSAVFASDSASAPPPMGPNRFARAALDAPLPVYALGGVSAANARRAMKHAAGWAGISGVMDAWRDEPT